MRFTFFILFFAATSLAFPRSITLKWNPVDDEILNYRIYWGTSSGNYGASRDVGDRTEYSVTNLQDNVKYYFTVTAIDFWGNESGYSNEVVTSGEDNPNVDPEPDPDPDPDDPDPTMPTAYKLAMNYPNPFNSGTSFDFNLPEDNEIEISIYNAVGQKIAVLEQGEFAAGYHQTRWDGLDMYNQAVASGSYFCIFQAGHIRLTRAITLLR
jgi:hypothetical protein